MMRREQLIEMLDSCALGKSGGDRLWCGASTFDGRHRPHLAGWPLLPLQRRLFRTEKSYSSVELADGALGGVSKFIPRDRLAEFEVTAEPQCPDMTQYGPGSTGSYPAPRDPRDMVLPE